MAISLLSSTLRWHYIDQTARAEGRVGWLLFELVLLYIIPGAVIIFTTITIAHKVTAEDNFVTILFQQSETISD